MNSEIFPCVFKCGSWWDNGKSMGIPRKRASCVNIALKDLSSMDTKTWNGLFIIRWSIFFSIMQWIIKTRRLKTLNSNRKHSYGLWISRRRINPVMLYHRNISHAALNMHLCSMTTFSGLEQDNKSFWCDSGFVCQVVVNYSKHLNGI